MGRAAFNRTGIVVCAYLIQECGMSVQQALAAFAAARPPGVKHEKFVVEVRPAPLSFLCYDSSPTQLCTPGGNQAAFPLFCDRLVPAPCILPCSPLTAWLFCELGLRLRSLAM